MEDRRMSFVDRVVVDVAAGGGGDGASSFARFKYRPKGGPDGGDGGNGGSIYVRAVANLTTLLDYQYQWIWHAERGAHGKGKTKTGASSADVVLPVPAGTVVDDVETGQRLAELLCVGDQVLVAKGGRGGRGNARFTSATHQAPREWEEGGKGERRKLIFTLKLIADVGLVGEPNAGKSTLLSVISAARPKIADYPFTTLEPNLGVAALSGSRTFVVADIPGIIEGAHEGKGLGLRFLQHVERTRVLAYMLPLDTEDVRAGYDRLRREVALYSPELAAKPHLIVLAKRDLLKADASVPSLDAPDALRTIAISSASGQGLEELKELLWMVVQGVRATEGDASDNGDDEAYELWRPIEQAE
jgi:GTP-binding protein